MVLWWDCSNEIWLNVVGKYAGQYCVTCFDDLALEKGYLLQWIPQQYPGIERAELKKTEVGLS